MQSQKDDAIVEGQGQEEEEKVAGDQAAMSNRLVESC